MRECSNEERGQQGVEADEIRAGQVTRHLPENLGDKPFELVLVELKSKPTGAN
jgi:hypothetical protein